MPKLSHIGVSIKLPFIGDIHGNWEPDESERKAAWELYVELVTRIAVVELGPEEGLMREALTSLYSLFGTTRAILRQYGPGVARPQRSGNLSFGYLAVLILNTVLRPTLSKWHPQLSDYESRKPAAESTVAWENRWEQRDELRRSIREVRSTLSEYADLLAKVAEVPSLTAPPKP